MQELGGTSIEADGGLLAVAACESHCVPLCRPLLPPVESRLEKLQLNFDTRSTLNFMLGFLSFGKKSFKMKGSFTLISTF